jgi:predicted dehydrogenase
MLDVAIVGLGQWGRHLVACIQGRSTKMRFTAAATLDCDNAQEFSTRHGLTLVSSYEQILKDSKLQAVVLATPHSQHPLQIIEAARAGKHVFVEKPLALSRESAEAAFDACRDAGVGLFVGYNWRFQPALRELAAAVSSGDIGDILHIEGNYSGPSGYRRKNGSWRNLRSESPAGGMTGRGLHVIDAMNLLCGPVEIVFAHSDRRVVAVDLEDTTSALLRFVSGATGYVGACQVTAEYWRLHVFGTKGWAEMRGETCLAVCTIDGDPKITNYPPVVPEFAELEAFADAVSTRRFSEGPIYDAINGAAVLEAIDHSGRTGQPVKIGAASIP